jgi:hypothetical protein
VELDADARTHLYQHLPGIARTVNCRATTGGIDWHQDKTFDERQATTSSALVYLNDALRGFMVIMAKKAPQKEGSPPYAATAAAGVTTVPIRAGTLVVFEPGEWHAVPDKADERYMLGPFDATQFGEVGVSCNWLVEGYDAHAETITLNNGGGCWENPTANTILIFNDGTQLCVKPTEDTDTTFQRVEDHECKDSATLEISSKNPFAESHTNTWVVAVVVAAVTVAALGGAAGGWWLWRRRARGS